MELSWKAYLLEKPSVGITLNQMTCLPHVQKARHFLMDRKASLKSHLLFSYSALGGQELGIKQAKAQQFEKLMKHFWRPSNLCHSMISMDYYSLGKWL